MKYSCGGSECEEQKQTMLANKRENKGEHTSLDAQAQKNEKGLSQLQTAAFKRYTDRVTGDREKLRAATGDRR